MAPKNGGGESRLGIPFLVETSTDRYRRSLAIIQETAEYLEKLSTIIPLLEMADSLPQNMPRPKLPEPLECLEWVDRVEKWGLVNPGTFLDQPKWFMEDIRATNSGRAKWRSNQRRQEATQPTDIPSMPPMVTR